MEPSKKMSKRSAGKRIATLAMNTVTGPPLVQASSIARQHGTITLLPSELLLRELLLDCRSSISNAPSLEIWITGGWVRDRLLGIPCSDVDIALSTMTGEQFGDILATFFSKNEERYQRRAVELGVRESSFTGFHTTKKNLGKSKQLATAVGKIFGLDVDLVNLRKEIYEGNDRTPEMEFGTAEDDAFRRDATVNALFFNMETQQVVDLTKKGLEDMEAGIMRTPLEPRQTFMDDPLRVLRLVRIGSKLGYTIDQQILTCIKNHDIHIALDAKVSRERIGIEIFKIMKNPNPQVAFHLLFDADLYATVFLGLNSSLRPMLQEYLPLQEAGYPWPATWPRALQLLAELRTDTTSLGTIIRSEANIEHLWTIAAYAPIAACRHTLLKAAVEEATNALRLSSQISKLIESSLRNTDSIRATIELFQMQRQKPPRSVIGMAIRSWGATWKLQVLFSLLADIVYTDALSASSPSMSCPKATAFTAQRRPYAAFMDFVIQQDLQDAHSAKPVLDGNVIMDLFGLKKGGSFLATAIDHLVAWQFDNTGCGVEDAKKWLYGQRAILGIP